MIKNPSQPWTRINEMRLKSNAVATTKLWFTGPVIILGIDHYELQLERQLPRLRFIGHFTSATPVKNEQRMFSELVAVWYQSDLHPILAPQNFEWLKSRDWEELAVDFDIT